MKLIDALRLDPYPRLALTGAGGKSAALFQIGRELHAQTGGLVILSATTHLALDQIGFADFHIVFEQEQFSPSEVKAIQNGLALITGPKASENRTHGLSFSQIDYLKGLADQLSAPLIVEADGSRQRPLKGPADHEPVVPEWSNFVLVCAGLSGLGKPLSGDWVHRPERFSELSGARSGEEISAVHLEKLLNHPEGGLKGIPAGARRSVLLNQVRTDELKDIASRLSAWLLRSYRSVLATDLPPANLRAPSRGAGSVIAVYERTAGVILAAGGASRYGALKQILPWNGKPFVSHVVETAVSAGLDPVIVVTGCGAEEVNRAIEGSPALRVHNSSWQSGQASSIRLGIENLPEDVGAAILMLADQPQVPPTVLRGLVEAHSVGLPPIVAPLVGGKRGNPVLFDRRTFPELLGLEGDIGGRVLFERYPMTWLPWDDPALLYDVDLPEDYQRLIDYRLQGER